MSRKFTDDDFVRRITRGHARWLKDPRGKRASFGFTPFYLYTAGICASIHRAVRDGSIAGIIARCPRRVRRDWAYRPRKDWTRDRILLALERFYSEWRDDEEHGREAGVCWSRAYIRRRVEGASMLRAVDYGPVRIEAILRQIGGPMYRDWRRLWNPWDPELMRERVREAHRRWQRDARYGISAGRPFNYAYLARRCGLQILTVVDEHYRGGIHAFMKTVPEAAADWQCRRWRFTNGDVQRGVMALYRRWIRDPAGRSAAMPFGTAYFMRHRQASLVQYLRRHGVRRVLRGRACAPIRAVLGKLPQDFRSLAMRRRRAALRMSAHERVTATA